eukprot:1823857-Prymnesium_polylepis.1
MNRALFTPSLAVNSRWGVPFHKRIQHPIPAPRTRAPQPRRALRRRGRASPLSIGDLDTARPRVHAPHRVRIPQNPSNAPLAPKVPPPERQVGSRHDVGARRPQRPTLLVATRARMACAARPSLPRLPGARPMRVGTRCAANRAGALRRSPISSGRPAAPETRRRHRCGEAGSSRGAEAAHLLLELLHGAAVKVGLDPLLGV